MKSIKNNQMQKIRLVPAPKDVHEKLRTDIVIVATDSINNENFVSQHLPKSAGELINRYDPKGVFDFYAIFKHLCRCVIEKETYREELTHYCVKRGLSAFEGLGMQAIDCFIALVRVLRDGELASLVLEAGELKSRHPGIDRLNFKLTYTEGK